jgi:hypothetical protein
MNNKIQIKLDKNDIGSIYEDTAKHIYGSYWDYIKLEQRLSKLKEGGAIKYEDLEFISDPNIWPKFSDWYQWPVKEQIDEQLSKTNNIFKGKHIDVDNKKIFDILFTIFKHIELVSIILRSVDPDNFGMYSPPVAYYLNIPRGPDYWQEYNNYLNALRKFKGIFKLEKIAYVDMFIWALSKTQQRKLEPESIKWKIVDSEIKKINSHDNIGEAMLSAIKGKTDIEIAEFFCEYELYDLAARNAGIAFEATIKGLCEKHNLDSSLKLIECIDLLFNSVFKIKNNYRTDLHKVRKLRNIAVRPKGKKFNQNEVNFMITIIKNIEKW